MADEEVALTIRMLAALEFVPPNDVIDLFDTFADYSRDVYGQDLEDMLDYFEDNYISRFRHNAPRKRPTFNIETWTCSIVQIMSYREPIIRLKDPIAVSNRTLRLAIHHFGNSSLLWNKRKDSFELVSLKIKEDTHHCLNEGGMQIIMREF